MAVTVPTYDRPQVQSRPMPAPELNLIAPDNSPIAQGLQSFQRGAQILADKEREKADTALLMDQERELTEWKLNRMFAPETGVYSIKGRNALDITNQVIPEYDKKVEELSGKLKSESQRARWKAITGQQRNSLSSELNRYEYGERESWYDETNKAQLATTFEAAKAYAADPQQVAYNINKVNVLVAANGQRKGLPAEAIEQQRVAATSALNVGVIGQLAATDPYRAQQYFVGTADSMTADDQAKINKLLGVSVRKRMADEIATGLWRSGSAGESGLTAAVIQAESGGDPAAVSPKGARGLMQLMPGTAKEMADELGIPFDASRLTADPNYNMVLGKAYLGKMLKRYDGNETLAVAAYNAGPGAVDGWLKDIGDPRRGGISQAEWIGRIPYAETREYTAKVIDATSPRAPASVKYSEALKAVNQIKDPELRELAKDRLDDFKAVQAAEQTALYDQAAQVVNEQGFNSLTPDMVDALPADELSKLRKLDRQRREGVEPVTDISKLEELLSMPSAQLGRLSLERDVRPYLDNSDFNTVRSAWTKAREGDGTVQGIAKAEFETMTRYMTMAGIQTGAGKDAKTPENLKLQEQFKSALQSRKDSFRMSTGKEPSLQEVEELAGQLLLDVRLSGTGWWGSEFGADKKTMWEVSPEKLRESYLSRGDMTVDKIPASERREIVNLLRATGQSASSENIVALYLNRLSDLGVSIR